MVNYTCVKCNKSFSQKSHYIEHTTKRKKPCFQKQSNLTETIKNPENTNNKNIIN